MYTLGVAAHGLPLLSQSARRRVLEEARLHILRKYTRDPAMPGPLRTLIGAMIRIFWVDIAVEVEADDRKDEGEDCANDEAELAAAPAIAQGMLQVLVVEARNLVPVHGIGTNPYVRAVLGQQVRKSPTAWSNLRPAWNCIMDFSVVSLSGTLELEVVSQAPLFGGDTRLGYVSLPLKDIVSKPSPTSIAPQLAYRCEPLAGATKGELVLILDYKPVPHEAVRVTCFGGAGRAAQRIFVQFRAFFLYHYWPCDKSIFQMYLKEPVDITILLISLCPFVIVRALFYTVLLFCLCLPWPPDEHQIVQFILAFKGLAVLTDGAGRMLYGIVAYYTCARAETCATGGTPGSGIGALTIVFDLYQEILVWCVCFYLLPWSVPFRNRFAGAASNAAGSRGGNRADSATSDGSQDNGDALRGGRIKALLKYNLLCFACCLTTFAGFSARDILAVGADEAWKWRIPENFFWGRVIFGLSMFPFLFLLHPQINKLLTHSTPTGYTCLGTLRRHNTRLRPRRRQKTKDEADEEVLKLAGFAADAPEPASAQEPVAARRVAFSPTGDSQSGTDAEARLARKKGSVDPVEDLKAAIRWFPGGSFALFVGSCGVGAASRVTRVAGAVVSLEIRAASAAVSLGLRAVDAGVSTALHVTQCVPGSDTTIRAGEATMEYARAKGRSVLRLAETVARYLPGGAPALNTIGQVLREVGFLAAAVESPGLAEDFGSNATPLLQVGSEKAEALKLEAAARLAEMLSRAERLAEREATEAIERVRPEIGKISQALQVRSRGCRAHLSRAYGACDSLSRSLLAWTLDVSSRLPTACDSFVRVFEREWGDLQEQMPKCSQGWRPWLGAYSRVFCSSICEAFLELQPQLRGNQDVGRDVAAAAQCIPRSDSEPSLRHRRKRSRSPSPASRGRSADVAAAGRRSSSSLPPQGLVSPPLSPMADGGTGGANGAGADWPVLTK